MKEFLLRGIYIFFIHIYVVKGEAIILKPQKKGSELNYEIIFNNLEKLAEGEYKSYANIIIKREKIGEKLNLKNKN